ncbi:MAG: hypothetical protein GEU98_27525 [Pseudonocardiaceae bacterium]|nr:hypothetical protein [Pseudonocardiaceae bacterium]
MVRFGKREKTDNNPDPGWYYCVKHRRVEHGEVCRAIDRLGPYPDEETASRALEIARARTEAEDAKDAVWNEGRARGGEDS